MRHIDGINVCIKPVGSMRFREYHNPYLSRPHVYVGGLGSRLITAKPGSAFEIIITLDAQFKIFNATGVFVETHIDGANEHLSSGQNNQCFWIPADKVKTHAHSFRVFETWGSLDLVTPTRRLPMLIPVPAGKDLVPMEIL